MKMRVTSRVVDKKLQDNNRLLVDADYYGNSDNDGEIGFFFYNVLPVPVTIKKGEKLGQGVFQKFLRANNHNGSEGSKKVRSGGFGSTGN